MKTRIGFIFGMVALFTLVNVGTLGAAGDDKKSRETLRGLNGVYVLVEYIDPEIEKDGPTVEQIKTDVELKLRLAGIKVLTMEEGYKEKGKQCLYVNANILKSEGFKSYVYSIHIYLNQVVYLFRNLKGPYHASTWSTGYLGTTSRASHIRNNIKDRIDIFINAYLSVNPK